MLSIAIIGGGICGISCAVQIKEYFKNSAQVIVLSEKFTPYTTGDISAGLWGPVHLGDTSEDNIRRWSKKTHDFLYEIWRSKDAHQAGVCIIPVIRAITEPQGINCFYKDIVFGCRKFTKDELAELSKEHQRNYTDAYNYVTFTSEPTLFLPYLMQRFEKAGGIFRTEKVESLNEFVKTTNFDIIINCTGMGARDIVPDKAVHPIRGQVVRVHAPWVKQALLDDSDDGNYVIPNRDLIVLGGTHQAHDYNTKPDPNDREFILNGCKKLCPSLVGSQEVAEMVGLRPGRNTVRLEKEVLDNGKILIHNYGHGGSGVTLAWGCAADVLKLILKSKL